MEDFLSIAKKIHCFADGIKQLRVLRITLSPCSGNIKNQIMSDYNEVTILRIQHYLFKIL